MKLEDKIQERSAQVGIIGLGYVGLPLAVEFAAAGYPVTGIETDPARVAAVERGESYIPDVSSERLAKLVDRRTLRAVASYQAVAELDCVLICVPTPLGKTRDPDISYIVDAVDAIAEHLHRDMLVVLESTTYPGTTEDVIKPRLEQGGLAVGRDFHLAFSPERVDPGNREYVTGNTPKVVGGLTPTCGRVAQRLYEQVVQRVVPVTSCAVGEMVKLLENTFRSVNIGLVNEIALMCDRLDLNVWEVIEAAGTKPFGFMPFHPGPGLGGHCVAIDPHYLSWKLRTLNYRARFIELASEINSRMPEYVLSKVSRALNQRSKSVKGSRVLMLGAAYKKDTADTRESPGLDLYRLLADGGAQVSFFDPYVEKFPFNGGIERVVELDAERVRSQDCVVIVTDHSGVDYQWVVDQASLVVDTRNATRNVRHNRERVVLL
jgi:UDP-N-acetyl-D-glucosamine dehydrogenase